jgi:hypothetical protein
MAYRPLGEQVDELYLTATAAEPDDVAIRMTPETWLSIDYTRPFG